MSEPDHLQLLALSSAVCSQVRANTKQRQALEIRKRNIFNKQSEVKMEKFQKIFATLALTVMLLCINYYEAESVPCDSCPQAPIQKTTKYYSFDCEITINYSICTGIQPPLIKIESVSWTGTTCAAIPNQIKMDYAVRQVLWDVFGQGFNNFQLQPYGCWELNGNSLVTCDNNICCSKYTYRLGTPNGYVEILEKEPTYPPPPVDCSGIVGQQCSTYCNVLDIPLNTNIYPIADACTNCQTQWNALPTEVVTATVGSCTLRVYYAVRGCPGNRREVIIWRMEVSGLCEGDNWIQTAYYYATEKVLKDLAQNFPEGDWYFRSTCLTGFNGIDMLVSCGDFSHCCSRRYTLANNPPRIVAMEPVTGDTCSYEPPTCAITCGREWNQIGPLPKIPAMEEKMEPDNEMSSYVKSNPAEGTIELHILGEERGMVEIKIINLIGEEIVKFGLSKTSYELVHEINTANYPNGLYSYRVVVNGSVVNNGKFIVTH